jgi:hypothetical protein
MEVPIAQREDGRLANTKTDMTTSQQTSSIEKLSQLTVHFPSCIDRTNVEVAGSINSIRRRVIYMSLRNADPVNVDHVATRLVGLTFCKSL